ncbi:MAG TPA: MgtC/SapB family protein [Stellaceae bacterium]|nr:MgtC/SapB family protein [Stellaceae bacterium]
MTLGDVAIQLAAALTLGAIIGFERQWRQRMAGLRTNALVALGAAGLVAFALRTFGVASVPLGLWQLDSTNLEGGDSVER